MGFVFLASVFCVSLAGLAAWIDLSALEKAFRQRAESIQRDIAHRFGSAEAVLTSLVGLHHASDDLRDYELKAQVREILAAYPYIRTIAKVAVLPAERRESFEAEMRLNGFLGFEVTERSATEDLVRAGDRPITMPIILFEPLTPEFSGLVGLDVLSDPVLSDAVEESIVSAAGVASHPITIPSIGHGFFVFRPVYLGHKAPDTEQARHAQIGALIALYVDPALVFEEFLSKYSGFSFRLIHDVHGSHHEQHMVFESIQNVDSSWLVAMRPFTSEMPIAHQGGAFVLEVTYQPTLSSIRLWFVLTFAALAAACCLFFGQSVRNHRLGLARTRESERVLQLNKERFQDYAESASDWFWSMDRDLRYDYFSAQLTPATGLIPKDVIGKRRQDLVQIGEADENWQQHLNDLAMRRPFRDFRYCYTDAAGKHQWWSISGKPVFDENGEFAGYRGTGRNVTQETLAQQALEESKEQAEIANRAKSEFLANVSHELRTPLNAIIGLSEVISSEELRPISRDKYESYAQDIHDSGLHLLALINDILDLSKVESGAEQLYEERVSLPDVLDGVVRLMRPHAEKAKIKLTTEIEDHLPDMIADQRKLKQVLVNLMNNAVKFTEPGGRVTLRVYWDKCDELVFQVEDTGIGMASEQIPFVFGKFHQIDSALNRKYEGTGLGLPLAQALTKLHGGKLVLDSELGRGTVATVRLPATRLLADETPANPRNVRAAI
ncbi:MAG: ATP-binding protein [Alphaproteobacteria bacterium]|nr:ATP-binding protein [Alphaproteobacteria bacterium]